MRNLQADDIALVASIALSAVAVVVGEFYVSPWFKALKIAAVFVSLAMAAYRLKVGRPFYKQISAASMQPNDRYFECRVLKSEHGRGKYATAVCATPNDSGGYSQCYADASVLPNGDILVRATQRFDLRLEVRR